ncbi:hypothetical protein WG899_03750 [Paucibacter sp. AS339]|uniref:hypothetical protein n=1 Tax=Paucibacter hankyongi TaxID=3133434 RepID=UPI0030B664EF
MDLESYLRLSSLSPMGLVSWGFFLAMAAKIGSTVLGLRMRLKAGAQARIPAGLWWLSKVSALLLCLMAVLLCHDAGDERGRAAFSWLLAAATLLVLLLARRRRLELEQASAQSAV